MNLGRSFCSGPWWDVPESLSRPASNAADGMISIETMPNLRTAIGATPKDGLIIINNGCFNDSKNDFEDNLVR
ncbi:unnamed protein product [Gongylonema pulchrum]|uniref:Uncharacterized protein n=1 Tax=Gongylonema pulchrum TaxID=637853 RepID=A0A3P6PMN4_9BILA|nr:unnamed protein product [Gongylonema pulchrum]